MEKKIRVKDVDDGFLLESFFNEIYSKSWVELNELKLDEDEELSRRDVCWRRVKK